MCMMDRVCSDLCTSVAKPREFVLWQSNMVNLNATVVLEYMYVLLVRAVILELCCDCAIIFLELL